MNNTRLPFSQLTKLLLGYLAIGLCGYALSDLGRIDLHIELALAVVLVLIGKDRAIYVCMLGSLILSWLLGVFNNLDTLTNGLMSLWSALGTLVLCKVSPYAIRIFLDTRWRSLLELKDFFKLLIIGGVLSSLIPTAFDITAQVFIYGTLSLNTLIIAIITKWLEIAIGACIFLPIFLSLILRNTALWKRRSKTITIWGLILVVAGSYLSLSDRELSSLITRTLISQETISPTKIVVSKIAEIEGAMIGFNQIVEITKTSTPFHLSQLSQRIFTQLPSIRSLSVAIDTESLNPLQSTTTTNQESLDYSVTNVSGYQLLQFYNSKYPKAPIDSAIISHYVDLKNNALPGVMTQSLELFSLVKQHKDSLIIVYGPISLEDTQGRQPNESVKHKNLIYADIDIAQILSSSMKIDNSNLESPWSHLQLTLGTPNVSTISNNSPNKSPFTHLSSKNLITQDNKVELATIKPFNQDLTIQGNLSSQWIEKNVTNILLPIKIIKLLIVLLFMICIFVMSTRQMRFRLILNKQSTILDQQNRRLTLFQKSIENAQESIAILKMQNENLYISYVNDSFCKIAGQPASNIIDTIWSTYLDFPINDSGLKVLNQSIAQGVASRAELTVFSADTQWRWIDLSLTPIGIDDSKTSFWLLTQQDISERKRIELELKRSETEARNLSATKSRFLENISHEIRTPLSGIIGLTNLAQDTQDPLMIRQHLNTIKTSANHQLEIITSILNALKIEASQIHTSLRLINVRALIDEMVEILRPNAQLKNLDLHTKISNNIPIHIQCDPLLLKQIMLNLLTNAIKFTQKGHVDITLDFLFSNEQSVGIRFSIADSGIGLGSLSLNKITKPFFKGELDTNTEGIGLGLAIAESYLQQMKSHLQVQNRNVFGGATFYFDLICQYSTQDLDLSVKNDPQKVSLIESKTNDVFIGLRFLMIEDNLINQIVLMGYLNDSGATIDVASNGESALSKISSTEYDLIFLDLRIPKFDTAIISKHVADVQKDLNISVRTPIIGISASQQEDYDATLIRYGLNDFLTKPIDPAQLFDVIKKHVFSNTLEIETSNVLNKTLTTPTTRDNHNLPSIELQQLFLQQALILRPKFDQYFYPHTHKELSDALHLIQGSAAALVLLDLQRAAHALEDSMRQGSTHVENYLSFIQLYDKQILIFQQSLKALVPQTRQDPALERSSQSKQSKRHFNILLIDDNMLVSKVLGSQIVAKGLSVDFAFNSEEALLKLDTHHYDVVVTDLILPDIDGLALTKIITSQPRFKDKIIFGLSAYVSDTIEQGCEAAGMKKLYSKLIDPTAFIATLVQSVQLLNSEQK